MLNRGNTVQSVFQLAGQAAGVLGVGRDADATGHEWLYWSTSRKSGVSSR